MFFVYFGTIHTKLSMNVKCLKINMARLIFELDTSFGIREVSIRYFIYLGLGSGLGTLNSSFIIHFSMSN